MGERDNQIYWTLWIQWSGTSDPQEYKALADTSTQCTLMPSRYVGAESNCISGVTGGSQKLTVLEAEVNELESGINGKTTPLSLTQKHHASLAQMTSAEGISRTQKDIVGLLG